MRASIFFPPPGLCRLAETGREASWRLRVPAAGLNHSGPMSNLQTDLIPGRADRKAGENWVVVVAATSPPPNLPSLLLPAHSPTLIHIRSLKKKNLLQRVEEPGNAERAFWKGRAVRQRDHGQYSQPPVGDKTGLKGETTRQEFSHSLRCHLPFHRHCLPGAATPCNCLRPLTPFPLPLQPFSSCVWQMNRCPLFSMRR